MGEALKKTIDLLEKKFGKGTVVSFEDTKASDVEFVPSGSISLDIALGGGYPLSRIVEIYGMESSGKTTLAIHAAVEYQKKFPDKAVLYIDVENAFDPFYGKSLGLDYSREKWLFSQPSCGEEAFDIAQDFLRSGETSLIVFDSVAVLIPRAELEGEFGESKIGLQARLMSQALRKMVNTINKSKCTVIFINQMRENIGVMYGDTKVTTGGNALKFYASQRLDCSRIGQIKDGDEVTANKTRVRIKKNKVSAPFRVAEFDIVFGEGIDAIGEIITLAANNNIIKKAGSWYSYGDTRLGQGVENVKDLFKKEPELLKEIEAKLKLNLGL